MKKILCFILVFLTCLILMFSFGCGSRKNITSSTIKTKEEVISDTNTKTKSESDTAIKSDIKTTISTNEEGEIITTTEKTDFDAFIDPKTGNLTNLPTHKETTTTTHKNSKKGEVKTDDKTTIGNKESKEEIRDNKIKAKKDIAINTQSEKTQIPAIKYVRDSLLIVAIIALIIIGYKYRAHILTALKSLSKSIKYLFAWVVTMLSR